MGIIRTPARRPHPRVMARAGKFIEETGGTQFPIALEQLSTVEHIPSGDTIISETGAAEIPWEVAGAVETSFPTAGITETGSAQMAWECGGKSVLYSTSNTTVFGTGVTEIEGWPGSGDYTQNYNPGDLLEITAGSRVRLRFRNIQGTEALPINIRNSSGGAVVLTSTTQTGILAQNCRNVHIDGTGAPGTEYGFQATAATNEKGVDIGRRSIHLRMNNVEIANTNNAIGLILHTKNDTGVDYEESSPGTPSTFSGANAWLDEDITLSHIYVHDTGKSAYYLGNNHAKRDNVPDLDGLTIFDSIAADSGSIGFNFKTQTNLIAFDLDASDNGLGLNPSLMINYALRVGCSGVLRDSVGTNATGNVNHGIFMNNSWRPMEVHDMTISGSDKRSITVSHTAAEEEDGGTINIHDNNLTAPAEDGIRFDVGNAVAAAGSRIVDNIIEHDAAQDCIEVLDQPLGTESGNTCTPI